MTAVIHALSGPPEGYPRINFRHPRNRAVDWTDLDHYLRGDRARPEPHLFVKADRPFDVLHIAISGWVVSERARAVFDAVVPNDVVFTPLTVNGERFWGLRVTRLLPDALDMQRSVCSRGPDGGIRRIDTAVWRGSCIPDPVLFQIPQKRHAVWTTGSLAAAYQAAGCTGIIFAPTGRVGTA